MKTKQEQPLPVAAKIKLTLCREDGFFGPGVCELLEQIHKTGSIQAAAAGMEMSYTKAWKILKRAEESMEVNLVTRTAGGRNGGSSVLTPAGEKAVEEFRRMERELAACADDLLKTCWHPAEPEDRGGRG